MIHFQLSNRQTSSLSVSRLISLSEREDSSQLSQIHGLCDFMMLCVRIDGRTDVVSESVMSHYQHNLIIDRWLLIFARAGRIKECGCEAGVRRTNGQRSKTGSISLRYLYLYE